MDCRLEGLDKISYDTKARFLSASLEEPDRSKFLEALASVMERFNELSKKEESVKAEFLNEALRIARDYELGCKATILLVFVAGMQYVAVTPSLALDFLVESGIPIAVIPLPPKPEGEN
jgi:hypothetical protein